MRLMLEPTERFFMAGEVMVRLWRGTNEKAEDVIALVAAVATASDGVPPGLVSVPPPTAEDQRRWAEKIMGGDEA